ncbi:MAG: TadE/TadG family type IV pilus assembly protein [Bradyrhizobium sp.]
MRSLIRKFLRADGGSVMTLFAASIVPIVAIVAVGVDYGRASKARMQDQQVLDAALVAAAGQRDATKARAMFTAMLSQGLQAGSAATPLVVDTSNPAAFQVSAAVNGASNMAFGSIAGGLSIPYKAQGSALAGYKPTSANVTVNYVKGYWYKVITLFVHRPGAASDTALATITYQPVNLQSNGGVGVGTATISGPGLTTVSAAGLNLSLASGVIQLGDYDKLYFKMSVKKANCAPGYKLSSQSTNTNVKCVTTTGSATFDAVFQTDDPNTSEYLFVDGKQQPHGVVVPVGTMMPCATVGAKQEWEDGGGFASQDFGFTILSACLTPDANNVRLTN